MKSLLTVMVIVPFIYLLTGCSSKELFKPEKVKGEWKSTGHLSASIAQTTSVSALLENGRILTQSGEKNFTLPTENRLINIDGKWVISETPELNLVFSSLEEPTKKIVLDLNRTIASASVQDNIAALVFGNNELALYSLDEHKLLFKERGNAPIAVDARIAPPYFMKDLVLFLTLDGKLVIVNSETKQVLRSIVISSEEYFNNVTYLNVIDNHLVASTGSTVLALSQKEAREKYDIRNIAYSEEGIWITTKQGEVIALSPTLQLKAKKKFPFAHFVGLSIQNDKIYLLEQGGYMIALTKNLAEYDIYDVDMDKDHSVFIGNDTLYFGDRFITLK